MTLVPATVCDLAVPLHMPAEDIYPRAVALAHLAAVVQSTDVDMLQAQLDALDEGNPVYVEVRRERIKHQKLHADMLPRWPEPRD